MAKGVNGFRFSILYGRYILSREWITKPLNPLSHLDLSILVWCHIELSSIEYEGSGILLTITHTKPTDDKVWYPIILFPHTTHTPEKETQIMKKKITIHLIKKGLSVNFRIIDKKWKSILSTPYTVSVWTFLGKKWGNWIKRTLIQLEFWFSSSSARGQRIGCRWWWLARIMVWLVLGLFTLVGSMNCLVLYVCCC